MRRIRQARRLPPRVQNDCAWTTVLRPESRQSVRRAAGAADYKTNARVLKTRRVHTLVRLSIATPTSLSLRDGCWRRADDNRETVLSMTRVWSVRSLLSDD